LARQCRDLFFQYFVDLPLPSVQIWPSFPHVLVEFVLEVVNMKQEKVVVGLSKHKNRRQIH
jgi:hypothetical protein